jgi:hypothetical protein
MVQSTKLFAITDVIVSGELVPSCYRFERRTELCYHEIKLSVKGMKI